MVLKLQCAWYLLRKFLKTWGLIQDILYKIGLRCGLEHWIFKSSPDNYIVLPDLPLNGPFQGLRTGLSGLESAFLCYKKLTKVHSSFKLYSFSIQPLKPDLHPTPSVSFYLHIPQHKELLKITNQWCFDCFLQCRYVGSRVGQVI